MSDAPDKGPSSTPNPADDYAVGYGRPPLHTRFKPRESGNAAGRPKGSVSAHALAAKYLKRKISVTDNGVRRKLPLLDVIISAAGAKAAKGELKAAAFVLALAQAHTDQEKTAFDPVKQSAADRALIAAYFAEQGLNQSSAENSAAASKPGNTSNVELQAAAGGFLDADAAQKERSL